MMEKKLMIKNVGVLDMMNATEESISAVESIKNVGIIIVGADTKHLISKMSIKNSGVVIEVEEGMELEMINSTRVFDANQFYPDQPTMLVSNAPLIFTADLDIEAFNRAYPKGMLNGHILMPENLAGKLFKGWHVQGNIKTYPSDAVIINERLTLDENAIAKLEQNTMYALTNGYSCFDKAIATSVKASGIKLYCIGDSIASEGVSTILDDICTYDGCTVEVVPDGYNRVEISELTPLVVLRNGKKLYCTGDVLIKDAAALDTIEDIIITGTTIIMDGLVNNFLEKSSKQGEILISVGYPLINNNYTVLTSEDFNEPFTLFNNGNINLNDSITPEMIRNSLKAIYNNGMVEFANNAQLGAARRLNGENNGMYNVKGADEVESEEDRFKIIKNIGVHKL